MSFSIQRTGGACLVSGCVVLALYAILVPVMLPLGGDPVQLILHAHWRSLAGAGTAGVILLMIGFHALYATLPPDSNGTRAVGFLIVELALVLQVCKGSWEILLLPVIASHPQSSFLLTGQVIGQDVFIIAFRIAAGVLAASAALLFFVAIIRSTRYGLAGPALVGAGALIYACGRMLPWPFTSLGIMVVAAGGGYLGYQLSRQPDQSLMVAG